MHLCSNVGCYSYVGKNVQHSFHSIQSYTVMADIMSNPAS